MIRVLLTAALTVLVWGVTFVNTRALLNDFSALEINVLRFFVAYLALWAIRPERRPFAWRTERLFMLLGLTGVASYQLLENCAIHYTNASNVSILVALNPVIAAVLARVFFREKSLTPLFFVGFAVAITGVSMVCLGGIRAFSFRPAGDLMAVCAMLSWGFYTMFVKEANDLGVDPAVATRRAFLWALVFMSPFVLFGLTPRGGEVAEGALRVTLGWAANRARFASWLNLANLAFLGILASAACFVWWSRACRVFGVVRCTVGLYLIPVVTVVFAYVFLGETLTPVSAAGALLVIAGVVLSEWRPRRLGG